jgi:hypothetical protein
LPGVAGTTGFSISPALPNATQYLWQVPAGMSILSGQGSPQIQVGWTGPAMQSGIKDKVCVTANNACASTLQLCRDISYQSAAPVTPGSISGNAKLCPGDQLSFSVAPVARAEKYLWTASSGIQLGSGDSMIVQALVLQGYNGGQVTVQAQNACGSSSIRSKALYLRNPVTPGTISGLKDGVCESVITYGITPVYGADSYLWTMGGSGIIQSGQGSTSVNVGFGLFSSSSISVQSVNNCSMSPARTMTLKGVPGYPGPVIGTTQVCAGTSQNYSIQTVNGAQSYQWASSYAGSIAQGQGTKSIQVNWSASAAVNQSLAVKAVNNCGIGTQRSLSGIQVSTCQREVDDLNQVWVYPNPTNGILHLQSGEKVPTGIALINALGQSVYSSGWKTELDLRELPAGIYVLQIIRGEDFQNLKLLIE